MDLGNFHQISCDNNFEISRCIVIALNVIKSQGYVPTHWCLKTTGVTIRIRLDLFEMIYTLLQNVMSVGNGEF